ncbi:MULTISPECIES: DUF3515 family protein [unclassified Diaminobutyricimonas]|uniref:DUF3515 family protein n=1 Tax=unclassified Diaminobutyricimonas TaxID=2643261 RepID=UPI001E4E5A69|nr:MULTISPECIES: DUF3515 family protein [unclassified Diaminobutyricimonas]
MKSPRLLVAILALPLAVGLAGCAPAVVMEAAPDAENPDCASVIVRLPDSVAGLESRETDAQATAAWGDPTGVLLTCGVPVPGPSEMDCIEIDGIDWLRDASNDELTLFTTYGRDPAITVGIDPAAVSGGPALADLTSAVRTIEQTRTCLSRLDVIDPTQAPTG